MIWPICVTEKMRRKGNQGEESKGREDKGKRERSLHSNILHIVAWFACLRILVLKFVMSYVLRMLFVMPRVLDVYVLKAFTVT